MTTMERIRAAAIRQLETEVRFIRSILAERHWRRYGSGRIAMRIRSRRHLAMRGGLSS